MLEGGLLLWGMGGRKGKRKGRRGRNVEFHHLLLSNLITGGMERMGETGQEGRRKREGRVHRQGMLLQVQGLRGEETPLSASR